MRYFIEVAYLGTNYSGFQIQKNGTTVQGQIEGALQTYFRQKIELTGSSRTDAGVHARQNFFHFDSEVEENKMTNAVYHLNAILPADIVVQSIKKVNDDAHCRFDASSRYYVYSVHKKKDPFAESTSYFYPYELNVEAMHKAAELVQQYNDFINFSKKNAQAKTSICTIIKSEWKVEGDKLQYHVEANRFLRGMVKALTGTMLRVGREQMSIAQFEQLLKGDIGLHADFSPPSKGLCLQQVKFPEQYF